MKCSKIMLALIFMLAILTIGAVSASDDVSDENMTVSEDIEISQFDISVDDETLGDWDDYCNYYCADEVEKNDYGREVISYYFDSDVEGSVAVLINGSEVYNSTFSQDSDWVDLYADDLGLNDYDYGTYIIGFAYSGDGSHDGFVQNSQLVLTYNFNVNLWDDGVLYSDIVGYGENIIFLINAPEYETELNYTFNGKKYSILIDEYDPYLEISAEELQFGKNNFTFSFENDDYPLKIIEKTVEVSGLVFVEPYEIPYNGTAYVTLNLPGDANGDLNIYEVTFEWDDDELDYVPVLTPIKTVKVENGAVNASLSNLGVGRHYIYANYTGSDYAVSMAGEYSELNDIYDVSVYFAPIVNVPERLWINGTRDFEYRLPESYNGELHVEYGSNSHTYDVINGVATFTLSDIDSDEIELNLEYSDDKGNYLRDYFDIEVSDENPRIDLMDYVLNSTVVMGSAFYPYLTYASSIKGTMTVYVDDELYGIFDMDDFYKIETEGLSLGKHDVRLEYSGDDYYEPAVLITSFNLSYIDFIVPVEVAIGNYYNQGSDRNALIMFSEDATGEIKLIVDDVEIETKSVDGNVHFDLSSLSYGNHTLTFIYQNGNYESKSYTVDVKADYLYAFGFDDLIYGQGERTLVLPVGSTGDVKILIAGKEFTSAIDENGTVKFNITGIPAGKYEAEVVYAGDAVIPAHSETFNVTVSYAIIRNFETYNIFIGNLNTSIISLTLPEDAEGNLVISTKYWDNDLYGYAYNEVSKVKLVNGNAQISIGDIRSQSSETEFTVSYDGGDYDIESYDLSFAIDDYELIRDYGRIILGSPYNVTVRFLESAKGYIRVYDDDDVVVQDNIALVNGVATITFDSSTLGLKHYKLEYVGDDFEMEEYESYIVWPEDVILLEKASGDDDLFTVKMPSDASGNLLFYYGEDEITVPYSGGVAVIKASQIPKGSYVLNYFDVDDDKYGSFSFLSTVEWWANGEYDTFKILGTSQNVTVSKLLLEANDIEAGQDATVTVAMDNTFSGNIVINVGGVNYTVSVVNGVGSTSIPGLDEGEYVVTAYYGSLQNSATFKVISQKTDIVKTIPDELISMDDGIVILEFPSDATGSVEVFIDGVSYVVVDIINGIARIDLSKFKGGDYSFLFVYSGDELYEGFSKNMNVTVQVKVSKITAKAASILYSSGGKYSVTVYDGDGNLAKGVKITFLINGKSFKTVTTSSKGVASVKITKVPGTYKITSKFLSVSVTKKLAVTHVVSLKSVNVKKSAKSLVLTATLKKVNKKYLKGKKVIFKFNGKKYTAKTSKKGVAKVTIKKAVLNKLKVGKKITYSATYSKDTVKKTVKVKK